MPVFRDCGVCRFEYGPVRSVGECSCADYHEEEVGLAERLFINIFHVVCGVQHESFPVAFHCLCPTESESLKFLNHLVRGYVAEGADGFVRFHYDHPTEALRDRADADADLHPSQASRFAMEPTIEHCRTPSNIA